MQTLDRYLVILVMAVILPATLFGGAASWWIAAKIGEEIEARANDMALAMATDTAEHLSLVSSAMRVLARSPAIATGDHASAYRHALGLSADLGLHIGLASPEGEQIFNTREPLGEELPRRADSRSYRRALETGLPSVSNVIIGAIARQPLVTIDVPAQGPDGSLVLGTSTDVARIAAIAGRTRLDEEWVGAILDGDGNHIYRSEGQEAFAGRPAAPELLAVARGGATSGRIAYRSRDGIAKTVSFRRVPGAHWVALVAVPTRTLSAPLAWHFAWLSGGAGAALVLTALIGLSLGRRLKREATTLTAAAHALERREAVRVDGLRLREFAVLGDALHQAAAVIAEREASLREGEARYRGLVETQLDFLVRIGADDCFTFVNETMCRVLGRPRDSLIGLDWRNVVHPEDVAAAAEGIRRAVEAPSRRAQATCRILIDSGPRWFAWEGVALIDPTGSLREIQAVGRDVTDRLAAEEELKAAKAAADAASLAKTKFLAAASHDLRQPFQAMRLFFEVLQAQLDPRHQAVAGKLDEAMRAGEDLLTALLDVSTLDAGMVRVSVDSFPLCDIVAQVVAECEPQARAGGLELIWVPCGVRVASDRVLLARMLRNLVLNAIRYTPRGRILIGCRRSGAAVRLEVWDTGIGIAEEQLRLIFEDFYQVANDARDRAKGLGLGLSVVSRMGRLLNHPVTVASRAGQGSCFAITVPLSGKMVKGEIAAEAPAPGILEGVD